MHCKSGKACGTGLQIKVFREMESTPIATAFAMNGFEMETTGCVAQKPRTSAMKFR
jgi:hypothetical protein